MTLLFMGIIMNNSHKNTNVYMIIPRKPVSYQYLHELVNDHFTIRTESMHSGVEFDNFPLSGHNYTKGSFFVIRSDQNFSINELVVKKCFSYAILVPTPLSVSGIRWLIE